MLMAMLLLYALTNDETLLEEIVEALATREAPPVAAA